MTPDPYPGRCPEWFHSDPVGGGARCELQTPHPGRLHTCDGWDGPLVWGTVSRTTLPIVLNLVMDGEQIGEAVLNRADVARATGGLLAEVEPDPETVAELDGWPGERVLRFAASLLRTDHAGLLDGTVVREDDDSDNAAAADMARAVAARITDMVDRPGVIHGPAPTGWAQHPERMLQVAAVDDLGRRARAVRDLAALGAAIAGPGTITLPTILGAIRSAITTLEGPDHA